MASTTLLFSVFFTFSFIFTTNYAARHLSNTPEIISPAASPSNSPILTAPSPSDSAILTAPSNSPSNSPPVHTAASPSNSPPVHKEPFKPFKPIMPGHQWPPMPRIPFKPFKPIRPGHPWSPMLPMPPPFEPKPMFPPPMKIPRCVRKPSDKQKHPKWEPTFPGHMPKLAFPPFPATMPGDIPKFTMPPMPSVPKNHYNYFKPSFPFYSSPPTASP